MNIGSEVFIGLFVFVLALVALHVLRPVLEPAAIVVVSWFQDRRDERTERLARRFRATLDAQREENQRQVRADRRTS